MSGQQTRIQIIGDGSQLVAGRVGDPSSNTQEGGVSEPKQSGHDESQFHEYRKWNQVAGALTYQTRAQGSSWTTCNGRPSATRSYFDCVNADDDASNEENKTRQNSTKPEYKYKVGAGWLLQVADECRRASASLENCS